MSEHGQHLQPKELLESQLGNAYCASSIKFSKPKAFVGLGDHCDPQVMCFFQTCIFKREVIFGNIAFFTYKTLRIKNTDGDYMTVAHDSGYIEFASL